MVSQKMVIAHFDNIETSGNLYRNKWKNLLCRQTNTNPSHGPYHF